MILLNLTEITLEVWIDGQLPLSKFSECVISFFIVTIIHDVLLYLGNVFIFGELSGGILVDTMNALIGLYTVMLKCEIIIF